MRQRLRCCAVMAALLVVLVVSGLGMSGMHVASASSMQMNAAGSATAIAEVSSVPRGAGAVPGAVLIQPEEVRCVAPNLSSIRSEVPQRAAVPAVEVRSGSIAPEPASPARPVAARASLPPPSLEQLSISRT